MAALIVQNGKHQGTKIPLPGREVSVGRDESCYVRLTSADVSRVHCTLTSTADGILVKDAGSQNGVVINGSKVEGSHIVRPGDQLKIGPIKFTVEIPQLARPRDAGSANDDSIAGWLAESDTGVRSGSTSDTTEIRTYQSGNPEEEEKEAEPVPAEAAVKSIAEEAQEIIRRHFDLKGKK